MCICVFALRDVRGSIKTISCQRFATALIILLYSRVAYPNFDAKRRQRWCIGALFLGAAHTAHLCTHRTHAHDVRHRHWNRYPGCACDVASYSYLPFLHRMGFVPSKKFVTSSEIASYLEACADKLGAVPCRAVPCFAVPFVSRKHHLVIYPPIMPAAS